LNLQGAYGLLAASHAEKVVQQEEEKAYASGIEIIFQDNPLYPKSLNFLSDPPSFLWVLGTLEKTDETGYAVVGTRQPTPYGEQLAINAARGLSLMHLTTISGLARGVDTIVHQESLRHHRTVAFIGSGHEHLYPSENRSLAQAISQKGAVISEYPINTAPDRFRFPARNRLIAAFSSATIVVEAPEKSGALITSAVANQLNKPCYTFPGRVDMPSFAGNHKLLKENQAKLITTTEDLNISKNNFSPGQFEIVTSEQMAAIWQTTLAEAASRLMRLVLAKKATQCPGGLWKIEKSLQKFAHLLKD
jgi:DNA protecting protein DprA